MSSVFYVNAGRSDLPGLIAGFCVDDVKCAVARASSGDAIMCLAGEYPAGSGVALDTAVLDAARQKGLRVYVEYSEACGGLTFGEAEALDYHRLCVAGDALGESLPECRILAAHECWIRRTDAVVASPWIVSARVAGYRKAVFGLPCDSVPVLFVHPQYDNVLISTTSLSHFVRGRFAPLSDWKLLWNRILEWLGVQGDVNAAASLVWPTYDSSEKLPANAGRTAFDRNLKWLRKYMVDSTMGIYEGFTSAIDADGNQRMGTRTRGDCTGEVLPVFAYGWKSHRNPADKKIVRAVMEKLFSGSLYCGEPDDPCYGMLRFYDGVDTYYGDDNCRSVMASMLASLWCGISDFDEKFLRCMLSVLRTTGVFGFRWASLSLKRDFLDDGRNWDYYHKEECVHDRAHSQAWMWAGFMMAWRASGEEEFLKKVKSGIKLYMDLFPNKVIWTNGLAQEIARMLLPLAMLVEIEDTPEHRAWLERCWNALEPLLDHGGVRELLGKPCLGMYPAPTDNENYGVTEAPLIQENGDPCCDLLYTVNYAFPGLHEAAMATGDARFAKAASEMADFLARIQSRSDAHPELDGVWFRGFDTQLWDYYGSSADVGWSAWAVETGWTNSWIPVTYALRNEGVSMLKSIPEGIYATLLPKLKAEMSEVRGMASAKSAAPVQKAPGAEM